MFTKYNNKKITCLFLVIQIIYYFFSCNIFATSKDLTQHLYHKNNKHCNTINSITKNNTIINNNLPDLYNKEKNNNISDNEKKAALIISKLGIILSNNNISKNSIDYLKDTSKTIINEKVNHWLNQYGNSQISIDNNLKINGDFLLPIIDHPNNILFTQIGIKNFSNKNVINIGIGYRYFLNRWIYGLNTFYDYNENNKRFSVGAEVKHDYLKISTNGYFGLNNWHKSLEPLFIDYEERPLSGFDIIAEAYLPKYYHFFGTIKYEKYFGKTNNFIDEIKNNNINYNSLILGIKYKPIPLITLGGEKNIIGKHNDFKFNINLNYHFGIPLSLQLNSNSIDHIYNITSDKYDFVNRNYDIKLEYLKEKPLIISLPKEIVTHGQKNIIISAHVKNAKYKLEKIKWSFSPDFIKNGGSFREISLTSIEITSPSYIYDNNINMYYIGATAIDNYGNISEKVNTVLKVIPFKKNIIDFSVIPNRTVVADGIDEFLAIATIIDVHGNPVKNKNVTFEINGLTSINGKSLATLFSNSSNIQNNKIINILTNSLGKAVIHLTSKVSGNGIITARIDDNIYKSIPVIFKANKNSAEIITTKIIKNHAIANGTNSNIIQIIVHDKNNNAVESVPVLITTNNNAIILNTSSSLYTDKNGELMIYVANKHSGDTKLSVKINNSEQNEIIHFLPGSPNAMNSSLIIQPAECIANGKDFCISTLILKDDNNNLVTGSEVKFISNSSNTKISKTTEINDGNYIATITNTMSEKNIIGVKVNNNIFEVKKAIINFIADKYNISDQYSKLVIDKSSIDANDNDSSNIILTLRDINNHPIIGEKVEFLSSLQSIRFDKIDKYEDGTYKSKIYGKLSGTAKISVKAVDKLLDKLSVNLIVNPDINSAEIKSINQLNPDVIPIADGGNSKVHFIAIVKDQFGNPVPNQEVLWKQNQGENVKFSTQNNICITNEKGEATIDLISTTKAVDNVQVSAVLKNKKNGIEILANNKISFLHNIKTAKIVSVEVDKEIAVANGIDSIIFNAMVKDENDNLVKNDAVYIKHTGKANIETKLLNNNKIVTDDNGLIKILFNSTTSGTDVVTIYTDHDCNGKTQVIKFIGDISTAHIVKIDSKNFNPHNVGIFFPVFVTVEDKYNNPVQGVEIIIAEYPKIEQQDNKKKIASKKIISKDQQYFTDEKGMVEAFITSMIAKPLKYSVQIKDKLIDPNNIKSIVFVPDDATAKITNIFLSDNTTIKFAKKNEKFSFISVVKDKYNNFVPNKEVIWCHDKNDKVIYFSSNGISKTNNVGEATIDLMNNLVPVENITISARLKDKKDNKLISTQYTVTFKNPNGKEKKKSVFNKKKIYFLSHR